MSVADEAEAITVMTRYAELMAQARQPNNVVLDAVLAMSKDELRAMLIVGLQMTFDVTTALAEARA